MSGPDPGHSAWLAKAENDLLNIENNLAGNRIPWDTICFHAQQAAEKFLKAFLIYHNQMPPRTHDLVALLAACLEFDGELRVLEDDCRKLTYYAVGSRYPDDLYEPGEEEGREMVTAVLRVREEIRKRLSAP